MNAAQLLIKCLENEGVTHVFGIPGEENIDLIEALDASSVQFVITRHEQGAAFMADVWGRLTGQAGVCLSTLGPGATNLLTGVTDANMDRAPLVAIAGQAATTRMHKESHQVVDLVGLFSHVTKYSAQIRAPETVAEILRKAFKVAQSEKPGAVFVDLPENIARMTAASQQPLKVQAPAIACAPQAKIEQIVALLDAAESPMILVGNGAVRQRASAAVVDFAERLNLPVATTFMAKGAIPFSHPLHLGAIGLQAEDPVVIGLHRADLVLCIGYDMVEYDPAKWNPDCDRQIVQIDSAPAEVDTHYILAAGAVGDIADALARIAALARPHAAPDSTSLHQKLLQAMGDDAANDHFPLKPQRVIADLCDALEPQDIVISDVGAHKLWIARLFKAERPNTCIISNGFATMGIAVPGAIAAKLARPAHRVVAVMGDGGFMMNSQEIETAVRLGIACVIIVLRDGRFGLIEHHMDVQFGHHPPMGFGNPDLVRYAESFGARGYHVTSADAFLPTVQRALNDATVAVIDCPIDHTENARLGDALGKVICQS